MENSHGLARYAQIAQVRRRDLRSVIGAPAASRRAGGPMNNTAAAAYESARTNLHMRSHMDCPWSNSNGPHLIPNASPQANGLVPIVEPEVTLGPGDYSIEDNAYWSEKIYSHVFR